MDDLLKSVSAALAQVPHMTVLVVVVYLFLRYMREQRQEFVLMIKALHDDHLMARQATREAVIIQTETMGKLGERIGELAISIGSCPLKNPRPETPKP